MASSPRILRRPAPSDAGAAEAPVAGHRPSANLTAGDGYEERPSRSEQRTGNKPKRLLDRKSPIQGRMIGDTAQHVGKPSLRIDAVKFRRADQGVHCSRSLAAPV